MDNRTVGLDADMVIERNQSDTISWLDQATDIFATFADTAFGVPVATSTKWGMGVFGSVRDVLEHRKIECFLWMIIRGRVSVLQV